MAATLLALLPPGIAWGAYLGMGAIVLVGACLQGISGLGFAMFCAPIAALWFPELVPGPLLTLGCPLALMTALRELDAVEWRTAGLALAGRVVGTALAAVCMAWLSVATLSLLFAMLILAGVALSLGGWRVPHTGRNTTLAGISSGLMGTITSAGAPPFAIAMQSLPSRELRATLGTVFFIGAALSIATLTVLGRMGPSQFWLSLLLMPWMAMGFVLSSPFARALSRTSLRPFLLGFAGLAALTLLLKTI